MLLKGLWYIEGCMGGGFNGRGIAGFLAKGRGLLANGRLHGLRPWTYILLSQEADTNEWGFMDDKPGQTGVFHNLIQKIQDIGASGYELMLSVGIIGVGFSIIFTAISLLTVMAQYS